MDDELGGVRLDDGSRAAGAEDVREVGTHSQRRHGCEERRSGVLCTSANDANLTSLSLVLGGCEGRHHGVHARRHGGGSRS